ncbi:zinc-binding dehydrogenase [Thetidibacter halocola]|uniref:Zinc-binding dehydrogenase n=1 Tax=Thetidibacter halocola TaxID=2827239 RepID=A0A8J7WCI9_9RHOB|nr:zinc-binding dehydrogenase [Thetidibacter halocola]MBS0122709.1 zinc-binding dehydrogenase [Thetidibacter halocola]
MKAVVLDKPDGRPESVLIRDIAVPEPGPGQVLLRVAVAGLNYADVMMRTGIYPHPKGYPLVAGLEMAGTVAALGPGVTGLAVGDRIAAFSEDAGGFAEFCAVPVERVIQLPDDVSFETGAAFYIQGLTAWNLLHGVSSTAPGDVLLIHAIGGGVGLFLTQLAKAAGATVIGTVGTSGKEARALEFGADIVVNRAEADFVSVALEATQGRGVDKVIDSTGASILDRSFDAIRPLGHVVSYGEAEGKPYDSLWERLVRKSLTFTRMHLGHLDYRAPSWAQGVEEVLGGIRSGTIQVPVEAVFEMDDVLAMYDALASRRVAGKLLLRIG